VQILFFLLELAPGLFPSLLIDRKDLDIYNSLVLSPAYGSQYDSKKKNGSKQENHSNNNGNDISLEVFLKKLESIGITIDINKLRNCKVNNK
jgi:hypothetical protein